MSDPQPTGPFVWTQEPWGRVLRCTTLRTPNFFTSRDVALRDSKAEWESVAGSIGVVSRDRLLLIRQVHGTGVAIARRGAASAWTIPQADIIVTDDPAVAIGVRVADCAPVLLYDSVRRVAGAVHAGWRGAAGRASFVGVQALNDAFGSDPADVLAAIGPCLGACCGEVGPEVVEAFRDGGASADEVAAWFAPGDGDRSYLDLSRANRDQLIRAGVRPDRIFDSGLCTKTEVARLHSYRGAGPGAGRMLAAIRVPRE